MSEFVSEYHELDTLIDAYSEKFGQNFPTRMVNYMSNSEMINAIKKCLKANTPYEVEPMDDEIV